MATTILLGTACSDDENPLPNIQTMLADMTPDANGQVGELTLDDGGVKTLAKPLKGLKADSTYRIWAVYEVQTPTCVSLIGCTPVLAAAPKVYAADKVHTDALSVVSCWQGASYINLHIGIKGTNTGKHYFATIFFIIGAAWSEPHHIPISEMMTLQLYCSDKVLILFRQLVVKSCQLLSSG